MPGPYRAASRSSAPGSPSASDGRRRRRVDRPGTAGDARSTASRRGWSPSRRRGGGLRRRARRGRRRARAHGDSRRRHQERVGTARRRRSTSSCRTTSLGDLLVHRDGDLTVTVGAGVTLARPQPTLSARGQWLPVDSAFDGDDDRWRARDQRHRSAAPSLRDAARSAHRHHAGADRRAAGEVRRHRREERGRLRPGEARERLARHAGRDRGRHVQAAAAAARSATLRAVYADPRAAGADAAAICRESARAAGRRCACGRPGRRPCGGRCSCGSRRARRRLRRSSTPRVRSCTARPPRCGEGLETRAWGEQVGCGPGRADAAVVRCSWLPSRLGAGAGARAQRCAPSAASRFAGRVGVGAGLLRLTGGDAAVAAAVVAPARSTRRRWRHVVVLRRQPRAPGAAWTCGASLAPSAPAAALKRALDPAGILNAGRGPL